MAGSVGNGRAKLHVGISPVDSNHHLLTGTLADSPLPRTDGGQVSCLLDDRGLDSYSVTHRLPIKAGRRYRQGSDLWGAL